MGTNLDRGARIRAKARLYLPADLDDGLVIGSIIDSVCQAVGDVLEEDACRTAAETHERWARLWYVLAFGFLVAAVATLVQ